LTKADKLARGEAARTLAAVRKECAALGSPASVQLFSALGRQGIDEARAAIAALLSA